MTKEELRVALAGFADPTAARYMQTVISDTRYEMLWVRMPQLRSVAKRAAKEDWQRLTEGTFGSYEELLCAALAACYAQVPLKDKLTALGRLLPKIDSWGMTDSIVTTLRFSQAERPLLWAFALQCLEGAGEYTVRFGVVVLLRFFLTPEEIPEVSRRLCAIRDERYYVQMAVAWCFAEMAVTDFEIVEKILETGELHPFIHNKTIQKMRESYRISAKKKEAALRLRRK